MSMRNWLSALSSPPGNAHMIASPPSLPPSIDGPKLNLGCGLDIRPGWVNIDLHRFHNPDIVCDVTDLASISDQYAAFALAQDILEHLHRVRCMTALQEWNRVLKVGGRLEIRVPSVEGVIDLLRQPERRSYEHQMVLIQALYGTQSYNGDFHLNGFTEVTLRSQLESAGFEVEAITVKDEWLFEVVARKVDHRPPDPILRIKTDGDFVDAAYKKFLGRDPDDGGRHFFLKNLEDGNPREVILEILKHGERPPNSS